MSTFHVMVMKKDLAKLLGIDICDFKNSSSVEDCITDAYNTSVMQFTTILFQHFWWYFSSEAILSLTPNNVFLKTFNGDGYSLNAVFSFRSLEFCIISCKHSSDIRWQKKHWLISYVSKAERSFYRRKCLVFNLPRILLPFLTSSEIMDSAVEVSLALLMKTKSFLFQVISISVHHNIAQVTVEFW